MSVRRQLGGHCGLRACVGFCCGGLAGGFRFAASSSPRVELGGGIPLALRSPSAIPGRERARNSRACERSPSRMERPIPLPATEGSRQAASGTNPAPAETIARDRRAQSAPGQSTKRFRQARDVSRWSGRLQPRADPMTFRYALRPGVNLRRSSQGRPVWPVRCAATRPATGSESSELVFALNERLQLTSGEET